MNGDQEMDWGKRGGQKKNRRRMTAHTNDMVSLAALASLFFLRRHEYRTWRCCQLHSDENPGETIPQSAYPKCSPLPTGDWRTQQQHECCTPG